jgi:hypothetical protein
LHTFKVATNSWHYKLLTKANRSYTPKDFCSYWREVVIVIVMCILFIFMLLPLVGFFIFWSVWSLIYEPMGILLLLGVMLIFICVSTFVGWLFARVDKSYDDEPKQPPLLATKYHSWKHKYCPAIEYDHDTK